MTSLSLATPTVGAELLLSQAMMIHSKAGKHGVVYGLKLIGTDEFRYVGQTARPVEARLYHHAWQAIRYPEKMVVSRWIKKHGADRVIGVVLRVLPGGDTEALDSAERELISGLRAEGHRLLNQTPGGRGFAGDLASAMKREAWAARSEDENAEIIKKMVKNRAESQRLLPEDERRRRAAVRGARYSEAWAAKPEEERAAIVARRLDSRRARTPEQRAQSAQKGRQTRAKRSPEERAEIQRKRLATLANRPEEVRAESSRRKSESHYSKTEEEREAIRQRKSEGMKASHARRKAAALARLSAGEPGDISG